MEVHVPGIEFSLPGIGGGIALARDFTRRALAGWAYLGSHDDVVLVVSELLTNAQRHGRGVPLLRLAGTGNRVRVEVSDASPVPPRARQSGPDGGWGVHLVERLSHRWGVSFADNGGGKVVWCELVAENGVAPG